MPGGCVGRGACCHSANLYDSMMCRSGYFLSPRFMFRSIPSTPYYERGLRMVQRASCIDLIRRRVVPLTLLIADNGSRL